MKVLASSPFLRSGFLARLAFCSSLVSPGGSPPNSAHHPSGHGAWSAITVYDGSSQNASSLIGSSLGVTEASGFDRCLYLEMSGFPHARATPASTTTHRRRKDTRMGAFLAHPPSGGCPDRPGRVHSGATLRSLRFLRLLPFALFTEARWRCSASTG